MLFLMIKKIEKTKSKLTIFYTIEIKNFKYSICLCFLSLNKAITIMIFYLPNKKHSTAI